MLGSMRYPVKFVMCSTFAIPLLAAFIVGRGESMRAQGTKLFVVATCALAFMAGIVTIAYWRPVENVEWSTTLWSGVTRTFFMAAIVGGVWWHAQLNTRAKRIAVVFGVVILVWLDGYTHVPSQNPIVDNSVFSPDLLKAEPITPQPRLGESRAMLSLAMLDAFATNRPASQADNMVLMRLWQYENLNLLERIPKVDGFYPLYLTRERQLHFRMYGGDGLPRLGFGDFLGVSQVAKQFGQKSFGWSFRESYLPMTTLSASPTFLDAGSTITNLMLSTFDPRKTVLLPLEARSAVQATNGAIGQILSRTVSANRIIVEVETAEPNLLVVAQMNYPAWFAYVDGQRAEIYRANYGFQAIELPAGRHRCELRYEDNPFRLGAGIAALSGCACAGLWFMGRRRKD
jgi:hypothetical protein